MSSDIRLPDFDRPPVDQVVLGIAFSPLSQLRASHLGLFWGELNANGAFPSLEEFKPSSILYERLGDEGLDADSDAIGPSVGDPSVPRVVACSDDMCQQIAIQRDLLQVSWRHVGAAPYPRFDLPRSLFNDILSRFEKFVADHRLGTVEPRQAEISYINSVPLNKDRLQEDAESLVDFRLVTGEGLPASDHFHTFQRHTLKEDGKAWARLYITFDSEGLFPQDADKLEGNAMHSRFSLSVQGPAEDRDQAIKLIDKGHRTIVEVFSATITPLGDALWGKVEGGK